MKATRDDDQALQDIDNFINEEKPIQAAEIDRRLQKMNNLFSRNDIKNWIIEGQITEADLKRYEDKYRREVLEKLMILWLLAGRRGISSRFGIKHPDLRLNKKRFSSWQKRRIDDLSKANMKSQEKSIKDIVGKGEQAGMSQDELARIIYPTISLNSTQRISLYYFYSSSMSGIADEDLTEAEKRRRIILLLTTMAEQKRRERADLIAENELAEAWNVGIHDGASQVAEEDGLLEMIWLTALDERVCPVCRSLEGQTVKFKPGTEPEWMSEAGPIGLPPAHNRCRCAADYI